MAAARKRSLSSRTGSSMSWSRTKPSFRGASKARKPGIQSDATRRASGFRLSLRSAGMTVKLLLAFGLAGLTAGCFTPLYGTATTGAATADVRDRLSAIEVPQIDPANAPNGSPLARVGVEMRNDLIFDLTGGGPAPAATHRLDIRLTSTTTQVVVDVYTARPEVENYGINAVYT